MLVLDTYSKELLSASTLMMMAFTCATIFRQDRVSKLEKRKGRITWLRCGQASRFMSLSEEASGSSDDDFHEEDKVWMLSFKLVRSGCGTERCIHCILRFMFPSFLKFEDAFSLQAICPKQNAFSPPTGRVHLAKLRPWLLCKIRILGSEMSIHGAQAPLQCCWT